MVHALGRRRRRGGLGKFVFLFIVLPGLLACAGGVLARRPFGEVFLGTSAAAILGAASWILTIVYAGSQGLYDTLPDLTAAVLQ